MGSANIKLFAFVLFITTAVFSGCTDAGNSTAAAPNKPAASPAAADSQRAENIKMEVPSALAAEHMEVHEELEKAVASGGKTGEAAKVVEERLSEHFEKEEEYALPQLGLLVPLAEGKATAEMKRAIEMSDKLKAEMPKMMEDHKAIVEALENLSAAAKAENKPQALAFVEMLGAHARTEEQITYPAAILIGEYLKLKLK